MLPDGCNNLKTNAPGALVRHGTMDNQPNEALVIRCLASKHLGLCSYFKGAASSLDVYGVLLRGIWCTAFVALSQ